MALQSVGANRSYIRYAECEKGQTLAEGFYMEAPANKFNSGKSDYVFRKEDGSEVVLNGCGSLSYRMEKVDLKCWTVVVYDGTEQLPPKHKFAGKTVHKLLVYCDPDRVFGKSSSPAAAPSIVVADEVEEDL